MNSQGRVNKLKARTGLTDERLRNLSLGALTGGAAMAGAGHLAMPSATQKALDGFSSKAEGIKGTPDPTSAMRDYSHLASDLVQRKILGQPIGEIVVGARQQFPFDKAVVDRGDNRLLNWFKEHMVDPQTGEYQSKLLKYTKKPDMDNLSPEMKEKLQGKVEGVWSLPELARPMKRDEVWDSARHYDEYMKGPLHGRLAMLTETESGWWGREGYGKRIKGLSDLHGKENIDRDDLKGAIEAASKDRDGHIVDNHHMFDNHNGEKVLKSDYESYLKNLLTNKPLPKLTDKELKLESPADAPTDKTYGFPDRTHMKSYDQYKGHAEELGKSMGIDKPMAKMTNTEQGQIVNHFDKYIGEKATPELSARKDHMDFLSTFGIKADESLGSYQSFADKASRVGHDLVDPIKDVGYGMAGAGGLGLAYYLYKKLKDKRKVHKKQR